MRLRLRLPEAEAEATSRRQGLRVSREELEELKLLARREPCGIFHCPLAARRSTAKERPHGGPLLNLPYTCPDLVHVTVTVVLLYGDSEDAGRDAGDRQCG